MKKNNKGITLVALIITIIILLILAGVTLKFTLGNDGIIEKTEQAADESNKQIATECINFKITTTQIDSYTKNGRNATLQELADYLCKNEQGDIQYVTLESKKIASLEKITVGKSTSIFTKLNDYPYEFEINDSLQLVSIDNIKIATNTNSSENNYSINNYTKWPENTEVNLGNGVYGYRFTGTAKEDQYHQDYKCSDTGERPHIIDYGGEIDVSASDSNKISAQGCLWSTSDYLMPIIVSYANNIRLQVSMTSGHENTAYDIWVTYTK